jgi:hypothetical protein
LLSFTGVAGKKRGRKPKENNNATKEKDRKIRNTME